MRLRKRKIQKQALALALAASVAVAVPSTAHAAEDGIEQDVIHEGGTESDVFADIPEEEIFVSATWDAGAGEVEVYTDTNGHVISKQGDKTYDHTANNDNELNILNHEDYNNAEKNKDYNTSKNASGDTGSDAEAAKAKTDGIIDIQNKTDGTAEKINVNIKDVTTDISGNGKTDSSAVAIGDEVKNFDVNIEGTKIHSNTSDAAIDIGNNSEVNIKLKDTEIKLGPDSGSEEKTYNNQSGIRIGNGSKVKIDAEGKNRIYADDDADEKFDKNDAGHRIINGVVVGGGGEDGAGNGEGAEVTVTSNDGGSLTIENLISGIVTHAKSKLNIDGNDGKLDVNINNTKSTADHISSRSGDAIMAYGDVKVTDGADVNITDAGRFGIEAEANFEVSGNSAFNVEDKNNTHIYTVTDKNGNKQQTHGGIYHVGSEGKVTIDSSKVNIANIKGNEFGSGDGIDSEGADVEIKNGSTVEISADSEGIQVNGGAKLTLDNSKLRITKAGGQGGIYMQHYGKGKAGELNIVNGAKVEMTDINSFAGIQLVGNVDANITNDGTAVDISNNGYGILIQTDAGTDNTVHITDKAKVNINKFAGEGGLVIGYGAGKKTVLIDGNSAVKIGTGGSHGVFMYGSDKKLIVDNATLETAKRITTQYEGEGAVPHIEIRGGAKVSAPYIWNANDDGRQIELWVTGGTLTLTSNTKARSCLGKDDMQTLHELKKDMTVWPTNSPDYGNEKVVNFKLSAEQLKKLLDRLPDEHKGTYTIDGDTLSFITYGYDAATKELKQYSYVVDLSKYADGEALDVWVPAVILDYYYLDNSELPAEDEKTAKNAGGSLNDRDQYIGGSGKTYDASIRGQSIAFATLSGDYTTGNTSESDKLWYYWDGTAWKAFTDTTPIKAYSLGAEATKEGAKPIIGVKKPEPAPDPKPEPKPDPKPRPKPEEPDDPVIPVVPVVPDVPVEPVTPVTPAAPETPAVPAEAVPTAKTAATPAPAPAPADNSPRLPQTGAAWMQAFGLAAAGLMLSLGSLFKKGRREGE